MHGPVFDAPGAFRVGVPGPGWKMYHNFTYGRRKLVAWERPGEDVDIRVTMNPIDEEARKVPLLTLAPSLMQNYGRARGIKTTVQTVQRVDFGAHEGLVVYATRDAVYKVKRRVTQAFVRAGGDLIMVSYIARPELYDKYAPDFEAACARFMVLQPADFPQMGVPLPEDLPAAKQDQH